MGKQRRKRVKYHIAAKDCRHDHMIDVLDSGEHLTEKVMNFQDLMKPEGNIFSGLKIDVDMLKKKLSGDAQSVKSFKSVKSESGKKLPKREKLKMRRELFIKRFEVLNSKELKRRQKNPITDMNSLRDSLPSLENLLKNRSNNVHMVDPVSKKTKGIEKAGKQRKAHLQGIKIYQHIFKSKQYQQSPYSAIAQHVKAVVDQAKSN